MVPNYDSFLWCANEHISILFSYRWSRPKKGRLHNTSFEILLVFHQRHKYMYPYHLIEYTKQKLLEKKYWNVFGQETSQTGITVS